MLNLERDGYLGTFRGIAEWVVRNSLPTDLKAQDLFPQADNLLSISLLEQARKLYGGTAAEKSCFSIFKKKTKAYVQKLQGWETAFGSRQVPGRDCGTVKGTCRTSSRIRRHGSSERHHPMQALFEAFPRRPRWNATVSGACSGFRFAVSNDAGRKPMRLSLVGASA